MTHSHRSDSDTPVSTLTHLVETFRDDRDWSQFHDPKSLAAAISIEAAELQELLLWTPSEKADQEAMQVQTHGRIREELADVMIFSLSLASRLGIDVSSAIEDKLRANAEKYPVDKAKGRAEKYTKL